MQTARMERGNGDEIPTLGLADLLRSPLPGPGWPLSLKCGGKLLSSGAKFQARTGLRSTLARSPGKGHLSPVSCLKLCGSLVKKEKESGRARCNLYLI